MNAIMKEHVSPDELLKGIHAYITYASELLAAKDTVKLQELGDAVDVLCGHIVAMTPEESARYSDELATLRDRINMLGKQMSTMRDAVGVNIASAGQTYKAATAYQKNQPEA